MALFNRHFSQSDPRAGWKPDYWDVQALASRNQSTGLPSVSSFVGRSQMPQGWRMRAVPSGMVDMRQRIMVQSGRYLLRVQLDVIGQDAASALTIRTRPAAPGPQPWTLVGTIGATGIGSQDNEYWIKVDGPITISLLAAFGPEDAQSVFILRSVELFR